MADYENGGDRMPGYLIHLAEAELILDKMRKLRQTDDAFEQAFLTGTLLPDTRLKGEKRFSHFWDPDKLECLALGPDLARFTDKYGQRLNEPVMLGYLAHLHLDARYVTEYWPTVMAFYGCTGEPEYRKAHIAEVEIKRLQKCVPVSQFFSIDYYYGDYTKLNGYFIHYFWYNRCIHVIGFRHCDLIYDIHSFCYFTKCCISTIKMWCIFMHDKELRSC